MTPQEFEARARAIIKRDFQMNRFTHMPVTVEFLPDETIVVTVGNKSRFVHQIGSDDDEFVFRNTADPRHDVVRFPVPPDWPEDA